VYLHHCGCRHTEMPRAQHRSMRGAGKMLLPPRRKLHSAKPAHGSVLACTCTTRMILITTTTSIEAQSASELVISCDVRRICPWRTSCPESIFALRVVSYSYHKRQGKLPPECDCRYKEARNLFLLFSLVARCHPTWTYEPIQIGNQYGNSAVA